MFLSAHRDQCRFSAHENFQRSGLKFAKKKQIRATPVPLDPMESLVSPVSLHHTTGQMKNRGLSTNIDEGVYEEPNRSTLQDDLA